MKRILLIILPLLICIIPTISLGSSFTPTKVSYISSGNPVANILLFGYNTVIDEVKVFASNESGYIGYEMATDEYSLHDFMIRGLPGQQGLFGITLSGNPGSPEDIQRDTSLLLNVGQSLTAFQKSSGLDTRSVGDFSVLNGVVYWDTSEDKYKFDFFFLELDDGKMYLSVRVFDTEGVESLYLLNDKDKLVSKLWDIVEKRLSASNSEKVSDKAEVAVESSQVIKIAEPSPAAEIAVDTKAQVQMNEQEPQYIRIRNTACGIRSAPDQTAMKIDVAPAGKTYRLLSIASNGWYEIDLEDGRIGYISPKRAKIVK